MGITDETPRETYDRLCQVVRARGGSLKLTREQGDSWGLLVTLPLEASASVLAGGFVVSDLSEVDVVAYCLLGWLDLVYEAPPHTERRDR